MVDFLIACLGNPGVEYAHTRHNVGFMVAEKLIEDFGNKFQKLEGGALCCKGNISGREVLIARPQCFMNTSGGPVKNLMASYKLNVKQLLVVHDELDLQLGQIRIKSGGGEAGHNGLKSISAKLGTKDYTRLRIGIGRPQGQTSVSDYVLSVPKKTELQDYEMLIARAAEIVRYYIEEGLTNTQQKFN